MEFVDYHLETKEQFWDELEDMLSSEHHSSTLIEAILKSFLRFTSRYMEAYLKEDEDLLKCCYMFIDSPLFHKNRGYVRRRLITTLVKGTCTQHMILLIGIVLLLDGRENPDTLEMMEEESACRIVIEIIWRFRGGQDVMSFRLHRIFQDLLYEMCRVQRLRYEDVAEITDDFIEYLFQEVERNADYDSDPYCYSVIRIVLVLNEQYMLISGHTHPDLPPIENKVVTLLAAKGLTYKTFGSNIIILLNREREPCLQLLILKMLFQLFTTQATFEYFYTNDLRVLVDVFIRELHDLSEDMETLRHTYLRVLYPLLSHTQLRHSHYKREHVLNLLRQLSGISRSAHYLPISPTTARLVNRCMNVSWLEAPHEETKEERAAAALGMTLAVPHREGGLVNVGSTLSLTDVQVGLPPTPNQRKSSATVRTRQLSDENVGLITGEA
ncbi:hypothetical protein V1514DRAFT_56313 [Lipomyces japonicus]|uniref:uncharacterized protein n=1 Tax=Lipomyces japonicus TaxID=56871 RepID=UPI0034CD492C